MQIISPPETAELGVDDKLIFLAGPMKGSEETAAGVGWQLEAADIIASMDASIWVATPRTRDGFSDTENFEMQDQVRWEAHHLARAAFHGAQLYWYAPQSHEVERRDSEFVRPYAKTTNKEVFEWMTKRILHPEIQLCLGADPSTSGLGYEKARVGWDLPDLPDIQTNLSALCEQAVALAHASRPIESYQFWTPDNPYKVSVNSSGDLE